MCFSPTLIPRTKQTLNMKRAWEKRGFDPDISIKKLPTTVSALIFFFIQRN